jgi:hypothetical protein
LRAERRERGHDDAKGHLVTGSGSDRPGGDQQHRQDHQNDRHETGLQRVAIR